MGQALYTWLISPLVLIYKSVLAGLMLVVPNYGFALALLAIPHFLMMLPLRRLAETLESRERRIRATLDPQLKVIKDETRGQERHRRTAELYERYSYHPALSLRGSTSILLQVPLLMASFWMVKDIEGLSGSSFGPISDLGEPDRLLSGINALPFVMTLLNVLTIFTTANIAKAERIQGMMLAGLFCLILYSAPSALLIFWTANNLLSLVLNIWPGSTFKRMRSKVPDSKHGLARGPERYPWFGIYILSVLLIGLITTVFGPSALYASDPARYFYRGVSSILGSSPAILIATLIISAYIWRFSSIGVRPLIARGALFCAAATVLMAVAPFPKYGVLDGPTLSGFSTTTTFQRVAADLLVGAVAFLGTLIVIRKLAPSVIIKAVSLLCGSLILFTLWVAVSHPRDIGKSELGGLAKALRYSEDQQNVLILVLDMFTGSHLEDVLNRNPSLRSKLNGFTWYRQTLATGFVTLLGMPAILGGHSATPQELNKLTGVSNLEKLSDVYVRLPKFFMTKGHESTLLNIPEYADPAVINDKLKQFGGRFVLAPRASSLASKTPASNIDQGHFPLAVSLFRILPNIIKPLLYDKSNWRGFYKRGNSFEKARQEVNFLDALPSVSSTQQGSGTFKVIYSDLTHYPYNLAEGKIDFVDDPYPATRGVPFGLDLKGDISREHLYTEEHAINLLVAYLDWMRANKIYDNTKVIVVSDHSWFDSAALARGFGGNHSYPGRPDALLLVKDFDATGDIKESSQLMSTADVPYYACKHLEPDQCEINPGQREILQRVFSGSQVADRELYHTIAENWILNQHPRDRFNIESYKVRGDMANKASWSKLEAQ